MFLGVRLGCAQCHNHPFDRWTQDDYYGWADVFGRVQYKVFGDWKDYQDFTAMGTAKNLLVIGGGLD